MHGMHSIIYTAWLSRFFCVHTSAKGMHRVCTVCTLWKLKTPTPFVLGG